MHRVAICGGSGYAGAELLRILHNHPKVEITAVTSEKSAGLSPADIYGHLQAYSHLRYEPLDRNALLKKADVFFMALPHGASQDAVNYLHKKGKKVIDLSADFRLKNHLIYEQWYKTPHKHEDTLKSAVYGLPELKRKLIRKASLIAVPGCYPTGAILGLYPLLKNKWIDTSTIVIDSKSGTTGAGRKSDTAYSFCEVNEGFRAYAVACHRHTPEIEQELSYIADEPIAVNFTPHLLPLDRGILTTMYAKVIKRTDDTVLEGIYKDAYDGEQFVNVLKQGQLPNIKNVRASNYCHIGFAYNKRTGTAVIVTAIDNIVKGAAGQAVQCMNLMLGIKESTGIASLPVFP